LVVEVPTAAALRAAAPQRPTPAPPPTAAAQLLATLQHEASRRAGAQEQLERGRTLLRQVQAVLDAELPRLWEVLPQAALQQSLDAAAGMEGSRCPPLPIRLQHLAWGFEELYQRRADRPAPAPCHGGLSCRAAAH
jgi:hypothetical protein